LLTSTCHNCGQSKEMREYANPFCSACTTLKNEAEQAFAAENAERLKSGELANSDMLYAGRMALNQRAMHANKNYTDPRTFDRARGTFTKP
jgi:hypothetical protein